MNSAFASIFDKPLSTEERLSRFDKKQIVIFGAGTLGGSIAKNLIDRGQNVVCYADETKEKWHTKKNDVVILPPQDALKSYPNAVFIVCVFLPSHAFTQTEKKLKSTGVQNVISFYDVIYAYAAELLPIYFFSDHSGYDQERYIKLNNALADDASRETLAGFLQLVMHGDFSKLLYQPVFKEKLVSADNNTLIIDAGAYNGDTLNAYLNEYGDLFKEYIALEPDRSNYSKLERAVKDLPSNIASRITTVASALTSRNGTIFFNETETTASSISEINGSLPVDGVCIDALCKDVHNSNILIKMDIEGAEKEALVGAEETITTKKPQMMICTYHKPHDTLEFFEWIQSRRPDYKFYLRSHGYDGADLVLYCL